MHLHEMNAAASIAGGNDKNGTRIMGSLLTEMNHDIRTSMNGVRGMLELLLDTGLTPPQQEYARTAQHNVDDLLESLERIVDMSLIETRSFRLNEVTFDLLQEVQTALAGKQKSARSKGLELSIGYPPSVRLHGDGARLRAAFSAFADVALQSAAGEHLSLTCSARYLAGGMCRIVMDAYLSRLSEDGGCLASLMSGTSPVQDGVGSRDMLGMAVCMRLVQMMKGTITVDRAVPPATVFRLSIDLPLAPEALAGKRALVLSEQGRLWASALAPLTRLGLQVDVFDSALTGLAAIDAAARNGGPYQLILMGRQLQGMDASIINSAIKTDPAHRDTLLVLLDDDTAADEQEPRHVEGFSAILRASSNSSDAESTLASWIIFAGNRQPASAGSAAPSGKPEDITLIRAGCTILVADDNPVNQQVAARMLEKLGCNAEVASDGMQAIEMHNWKRFDLILMDCDMPVLDGLEATQRIRATEGTGRRTPIVALTACTGQGEQERCLAAGMDDFLSKPIRPQMLADVLTRWLPRSTAASTPEADPSCEDELDEVKEMFGADFAELASLYQNDGSPRLAAIREAASAGDCAKVAKVAHALSGSSASIGATGLSALCKELETSAKAGSLDDFDKRISAIDTEYRRICDKLHTLITS